MEILITGSARFNRLHVKNEQNYEVNKMQIYTSSTL